MGSRSYSSMSSRLMLPGFPPGVKWLIISNVVCFLLFTLGGNALHSQMVLLSLIPDWVIGRFPFFVWQLVTYLFLHSDPWHLIWNMLALWMFGATLEQDWGTRRFLKFYFLCGIAAGLCDATVSYWIGHHTRTVGSSGAIYGLLAAYGVLYAEQQIIFIVFPIRAKYLVLLFAALELWWALRSNYGNSGVSNLAHLGGMAFGYLYVRRSIPLPTGLIAGAQDGYRQWKLQRAKRKFQVYMKRHGNGPGPRVN
jgi:membrane associated rhomboid family serine protease